MHSKTHSEDKASFTIGIDSISPRSCSAFMACAAFIVEVLANHVLHFRHDPSEGQERLTNRTKIVIKSRIIGDLITKLSKYPVELKYNFH